MKVFLILFLIATPAFAVFPDDVEIELTAEEAAAIEYWRAGKTPTAWATEKLKVCLGDAVREMDQSQAKRLIGKWGASSTLTKGSVSTFLGLGDMEKTE